MRSPFLGQTHLSIVHSHLFHSNVISLGINSVTYILDTVWYRAHFLVHSDQRKSYDRWRLHVASVSQFPSYSMASGSRPSRQQMLPLEVTTMAVACTPIVRNSWAMLASRLFQKQQCFLKSFCFSATETATTKRGNHEEAATMQQQQHLGPRTELTLLLVSAMNLQRFFDSHTSEIVIFLLSDPICSSW